MTSDHILHPSKDQKPDAFVCATNSMGFFVVDAHRMDYCPSCGEEIELSGERD